MGPLGPPEMMQTLGPQWERARRPLLVLLAILLAIIALMWWIDVW